MRDYGSRGGCLIASMSEGCWVEPGKHGLSVTVVALLLSAVVCQRASSGIVTTLDDRNPTGGRMMSKLRERLTAWFRPAMGVGANLLAGLAGNVAVAG